jgi:serine/threonine protein kinase
MDAPVLPGDVLLGKYRVERVLGQGGMGVVVTVRHVDLGQLYAIKFLRPAVLGHHEGLERFLREARAAAQLQSEHVARVTDVGHMENGAPYMVMEHLDGCDLKVFLARQGPLPIEDAVAYVLQVCDAIAEAHALGIIHRDLKPANLFLVRRRKGSACVKVLDFGISKLTGPEEIDLTNTNMALGSPLYMSPEQISKSKSVDGRTDIWALGVILYELLTGSSPFRTGSTFEVIAKVLQEEPRPLREVRPEVPEGIVAVVARCLRKRREDRFATIEELTEALEEFAPRAPPPRSSMASATNLEPAASATTNAAVADAPVEVPEPAVNLQGSAVGEPTGITFGQTGKPQVVNRRRSGQVVAFVTAGLVLVGGGWVGWRYVATPEATPYAAVSAPSDPIASASTVSTGSSSAVVVADAPVPTNTPKVREDQPAMLDDGSSVMLPVNVVQQKLTAPLVSQAKAPTKPPATVTTVTPAQTGTTRKRRVVD